MYEWCIRSREYSFFERTYGLRVECVFEITEPSQLPALEICMVEIDIPPYDNDNHRALNYLTYFLEALPLNLSSYVLWTE